MTYLGIYYNALNCQQLELSLHKRFPPGQKTAIRQKCILPKVLQGEIVEKIKINDISKILSRAVDVTILAALLSECNPLK